MRSKMLAENVNFLILSSYIGVMNHISFTLKMSTVRLVTIFISYLFCCTSCEDFTEKMLGKSRDACMRISKDPFFDIDIVIGKPWRIYYTWNMKLDTKCLDMKFKNATQEIIKRVWSDMSDYLEQQPYWEAATLHLSMGSAAHELLLFADQGAAGTFLGVPNIIRDPNIKPMRKGVPLLKFQMKLFRGGKYLLVMDCHVGGASLAARPGNETYRSEVAAEAEALDLGDGYPACINERNNDEQFFLN